MNPNENCLINAAPGLKESPRFQLKGHTSLCQAWARAERWLDILHRPGPAGYLPQFVDRSYDTLVTDNGYKT